MWLAAVVGALTTLIGMPLASAAIRLYGVEEQVVTLGAGYLVWLLAGNVPFVLTLVINASLRAAGDSRTPLVTGVIANVVNIFFNWILIYGHFGAPALGVRGAAMASSLAMVAQLARAGGLVAQRPAAPQTQARAPAPGSRAVRQPVQDRLADRDRGTALRRRNPVVPAAGERLWHRSGGRLQRGRRDPVARVPAGHGLRRGGQRPGRAAPGQPRSRRPRRARDGARPAGR